MQEFRVLLIEDNPGDADLIRIYLDELNEWHIELEHVLTVSDACSNLENNIYDVVLTDLNLPDSKALHTVSVVKQCAKGMPLIVLTGHNDNASGLEAIRLGAQDYLAKEDITSHLLAKTILYAIERNKSKLLIESMAITDELTGLYNRAGLKMLSSKMSELARRHGKQLGIFFIDINAFKSINDTFGHEEGDLALQDTARLLNQTFRHSDIITRYGGDEFVVFFLCEKDCKEEVVKNRFLKNVEHHNLEMKRKWQLGLSIGVVLFLPNCDENLDQMIRKADQLMYEDKFKMRQNNN